MIEDGIASPVSATDSMKQQVRDLLNSLLDELDSPAPHESHNPHLRTFPVALQAEHEYENDDESGYESGCDDEPESGYDANRYCQNENQNEDAHTSDFESYDDDEDGLTELCDKDYFPEDPYPDEFYEDEEYGLEAPARGDAATQPIQSFGFLGPVTVQMTQAGPIFYADFCQTSRWEMAQPYGAPRLAQVSYATLYVSDYGNFKAGDITISIPELLFTANDENDEVFVTLKTPDCSFLATLPKDQFLCHAPESGSQSTYSGHARLQLLNPEVLSRYAI